MATVKEAITVECRGIDEYYEALRVYKLDGYVIKEYDDSNCLTFKAYKQYKVWEVNPK